MNRPFNLNYQPTTPFTNVTNTKSPYTQSKNFHDSYNADNYRY